MRISFRGAHAHLIKGCTCASTFGMRVCNSFTGAHAHLTQWCACVSAFWAAYAHLILVCTCAYLFRNISHKTPSKFVPKMCEIRSLNQIKSNLFV